MTSVEAFCEGCRARIIAQITEIVSRHGWNRPDLDRLVLDYPLRSAKALRPAICIAVARTFGATDAAVFPTAAVVELLHNAFLIHDDIEDQSLLRRGEETLHKAHGAPIAINVGDGMFALAVSSLLDNTELLGVRVALEMFGAVSRMFHATVEGQAIELGWIRENRCRFPRADYRAAYEEMVLKKTAIYSFVIPVEIGCIAADVPPPARQALDRYARHLGIAFQIADDLLNLRVDVDAYGKESLGDLWEGKRTLMLLHALAWESDPRKLERAEAILALPRPQSNVDGPVKTEADVALLKAVVDEHRGIAFATEVAREHVTLATAAFESVSSELSAGPERDFLADLPRFVVERLR
ncbi:MAG: polyprenyl synthetase family protein [Labilithrix sp.]|nr:polyprenyl synthetase family protein [Labilithrix sp.]